MGVLFKVKETGEEKSLKQLLKEQIKDVGENSLIGTVKLELMGGLELKAKKDVVCTVYKDKITFKQGFSNVEILKDDIKNIELQSQEQISKDVTLTRLIAFGIFAFGMKKKRVDVKEYGVLAYNVGDMKVKAVFKGSDVNKFISYIIKMKSN